MYLGSCRILSIHRTNLGGRARSEAITYLGLAENEGMEKKMETTILYIRGFYRDYYNDPFLHS